MVDDMKRKVNKGAKRRLFLWFVIFVLLISYMSLTSFRYWKDIIKNKSETKVLNDEYNKLVADKKNLERDVVKLQDKDYVAKYAREKYLYSKDGELIIKIVDENE